MPWSYRMKCEHFPLFKMLSLCITVVTCALLSLQLPFFTYPCSCTAYWLRLQVTCKTWVEGFRGGYVRDNPLMTNFTNSVIIMRIEGNILQWRSRSNQSNITPASSGITSNVNCFCTVPIVLLSISSHILSLFNIILPVSY